MSKIIKSIAPKDIHNLSFHMLTPEILKEMPRKQIMNIPKDQIKKLDQKQIDAIEDKFNDEELAYVQRINLGLYEEKNMNLSGRFDHYALSNEPIKPINKLMLIKPRAMDFIPIERIN